MKNLLLPLLLFFCSVAYGQDTEQSTVDSIYLSNIRTVRFHLVGLPVSAPLIELQSSSRLLLTFDDMDGDDKNYSYRLTHHNADWKDSGLSEAEFVESFSEADIEEYDFAFNTKTNFTHYALMLPNQDVRFSISGNFVLTIFDSDTEETVLTRRFTVIEPLATVEPTLIRPARAEKQDTHHEIDFTVGHEQFRIKRPLMELKAVVLQNARWDNAIMDLRPRLSNNDISVFDYQDRVIFEAGQEFRYVDIRSLDYRQLGVKNIEEFEDGYDVGLNPDSKRVFKGFSSFRDINGDFIIDNTDVNVGVVPIDLIQTLEVDDGEQINTADRLRTPFASTAQEYMEGDGIRALAADYANVIFSLKSPTEYYDYDMYVFGKLTDWQVKPEFKLNYSDKHDAYIGEALLKQGFYNYYYVLSPKGKKEPAWRDTEGNWYETENTYTIIVYYRGFTDRYDRVIAAYTFASGWGF